MDLKKMCTGTKKFRFFVFVHKCSLTNVKLQGNKIK